MSFSYFRAKLGIFLRGIHGWLLEKREHIPLPPETTAEHVLGHSVQGRKIVWYRIGAGAKKVLFVGGIHGNEVGTVKLMRQFLVFLIENESDFSHGSWYVVPCLNPDGYAVAEKYPGYFSGGHEGRLNANRVDLNRNFEVPSFKENSHWGHGKDYSESTSVFSGDKPFSEPETRLLRDFLVAEKIQAIYMFHNRGVDVVGAKDSISQALARRYAEQTSFRFIEDSEWQTFGLGGTLKEWAELHGIHYVEIEGTTRWGSDWKRQKQALIAALSS